MDLKKAGFVALIIMNVSLVAFLFYSNQQHQAQVAKLIAQQQSDVSPSKSQNSRQEPPLYIQNEVKNRIIKGYGDMQGCYMEHLKVASDKTDGAVQLDWQITPEGKVKRPEVVVSDFLNKKLGVCMVGKLGSWEFPLPPDGRLTYVSHRFNFRKDPSK